MIGPDAAETKQHHLSLDLSLNFSPPIMSSSSTIVPPEAESTKKKKIPTAKDRWQLLRRALLKQKPTPSASNNETVSLHSFRGYRLIQPCPISSSDSGTNKEDKEPAEPTKQDSTTPSAVPQENEENEDRRGQVVRINGETLRRSLCQLQWDPTWKVSLVHTPTPDPCSALVQKLHDTMLACQALSTTMPQTCSSQPDKMGAFTVCFYMDPTTGSTTRNCIDFLQHHQSTLETQLLLLAPQGIVDHDTSSSSTGTCHMSWWTAMDSNEANKDAAVVHLGMEWTNPVPDRHYQRDVHQVQCYPISGSATNMSQPLETTNEWCQYVLVRERMSRHHFSLHELASHNHNNKNQIDNTGNVCIWDAEKTLTWALHQELQQQLALRKTRNSSTAPTDPEKHPTTNWLPLLPLSPSHTSEPDTTTTTTMVLGTVLELGAGMAGLAALSLGPYAHRIVVTDGHLHCVQNNRVSVHLTRAWQATTTRTMDHSKGSSSSWPNRVDCRPLLWTLGDPTTPTSEDATASTQSSSGANDNDSATSWTTNVADLTLISDCTHFEDYHGALLWTLLHCTQVESGRIWMCQPERGQSLQRFVDLIHAVNKQSTTTTTTSVTNGDTNNTTTTTTTHHTPLVQILGEPHFDRLEQLHQHFMGRSQQANQPGEDDTSSTFTTMGDPYYRPNVHRPRILVLRKLRPLTDEDRHVILHHLQKRQRQGQNRNDDATERR